MKISHLNIFFVQELITKMFEILSIACESVQREVIACIPEVVEDIQHANVARQLR